jgi:hypothetical protein
LTIALPDLNDASASLGRSLVLTLTGAGGSTIGRFTIGDGAVLSVPLDDDDSNWVGILTPDEDGTELPIHIFVTDGTEACLKTDSSSIFPVNPEEGSGGNWAAAPGSFVLSPTTFNADFGPIPVPDNEVPLAPPLQWTLSLEASSEGITGRTVTGTFALVTSSPTATYLSFAPRTGTFTLLRTTPPPADAGPLTPAP